MRDKNKVVDVIPRRLCLSIVIDLCFVHHVDSACLCLFENELKMFFEVCDVGLRCFWKFGVVVANDVTNVDDFTVVHHCYDSTIPLWACVAEWLLAVDHQIQRNSRHAAELHFERCLAGGDVNGGVVSETKLVEEQVPVVAVVVDEGGDHFLHRLDEPFRLAVCLRVVGGGA